MAGNFSQFVLSHFAMNDVNILLCCFSIDFKLIMRQFDWFIKSKRNQLCILLQYNSYGLLFSGVFGSFIGLLASRQ